MRALPTALALALAGPLTACESVPPPASPASPASAPASPSAPITIPGTTAVADPANVRELPANATFADVVRAARAATTQKFANTCLLRGGKPGQPATIESPFDLRGAPLADPPADLDALLGQPQQRPSPSGYGLRVLTPSHHTHGGNYLDLRTFTPASPILASGSPALIATDKGIYLVWSGETSKGRPISPDERARIAQEIRSPVWVVAAEGDAPISRLREALELIVQNLGTVVLAVPLPEASGARKDIDDFVNQDEPYACSDAALGFDLAGESSPDRYVSIIRAFTAAAESCGETLGMGAGGTIHINARINAQGVIEEACAQHDDTGDPTLRKCVIEAVKKLDLPKSNRHSVIGITTPVRFTGKPVRPLCDP